MSAAVAALPQETHVESQRPSRTKLYALIGLMTLIWALNFIVAKAMAKHMPLVTLAALRTIVAGLCILPLFLLKGEGRWRPADIPGMVILGFCGVALNQGFFVVGIGQTSVAHAAIVAALAPVQVLLIAALRGQERITAMRLGGLAIAFTGVAVLQLAKGTNAGATLRGDFFIYVSALLFAIFSVFGKDYSRRLGTITMTGFSYIGSGFLMIPVVLITGRDVAWGQLPMVLWLGLLYMAVFSSVVAYLIYYYALTWVPASRVAAFSYTQPILASFLGWLLLSEPLTVAVIGSAALVLIGVIVVERGR